MKEHKITKADFLEITKKLKAQGIPNVALIYYDKEDCWWASNLVDGMLSLRQVLFQNVIPDVHRFLDEEGSAFMQDGISIMLGEKKVCPHCNQILPGKGE
jgi:hypothetical protein